MGQEFYWVIGQGTDVGKTTLATALLRILNRRHYPALGFKPYSATLLTSVIDAMCDPDATDKGKLFGSDAVDLATHSPLTGIADVECIVPVQYICYPNFHSAIVARIGSDIIGDRLCLRSDHQRAFLDRSDIVAIFDRNDAPTRDMVSADHLRLSTCPARSQDHVARSYRNLASRDGVTAIICEGVGQFLPLWRGMPVIDHLFYVEMSSVRFFPNIRLDLKVEQHDTLYSCKLIDHVLRGDGGLFELLPMVDTAQRERVAEEVVDNLLRRASPAQGCDGCRTVSQ
jgi:hypothetical protein